MARDLIKAGIEVHVFNHRDVTGIFRMVTTLGALVDKASEATKLCEALQERISKARTVANTLPRRPRIYFEEWFDPMISGIGWASELIIIAGGDDVFAELAAKQRIIADGNEVIARAPGAAAIERGLTQLSRIVGEWARRG